MNLTKELWGNYEGRQIYLFKLKNDTIEVTLSNFGAGIISIITPDKNGQQSNIVLGYDTLNEYIDDEFYIGCVVGRFAGRISNAEFSINDITYKLAKNDGKNSLHGGNKGFNKQAFTVTGENVTDDNASVEFYYRSAHLEESYPGNLDVWVSYTLTINNELIISYKAVSDQDTHVNLTNHSYFNLSGENTSALNHNLFIDADSYLQTDASYIPTGAVKPVKNTPYDFGTSRSIAGRMAELNGTGYNECYVLNRSKLPAAILTDDSSGRTVTVETDMPALLFYSGDYLYGKFIKNSGVCLETQFFPDAPNQPDFTGTLISASEVWNSYTKFKFS